eukprot:11179006-Lingulodinium_polyedra.AAC.1
MSMRTSQICGPLRYDGRFLAGLPRQQVYRFRNEPALVEVLVCIAQATVFATAAGDDLGPWFTYRRRALCRCSVAP